MILAHWSLCSCSSKLKSVVMLQRIVTRRLSRSMLRARSYSRSSSVSLCRYQQQPTVAQTRLRRFSRGTDFSGVARNFQWGGVERRGAEGAEGGRVWGGGIPLPTEGGVWGGGFAPPPENFWILYIKTVTFVHSGWHYLPCI